MKNYHTQMEAAKKGIITPEMEIVANNFVFRVLKPHTERNTSNKKERSGSKTATFDRPIR